ncbi:MAG: ATPase [Caldilineae bacterium]|nr:MAG: ATPase [Caldilineae bacterium]
MDVAFELLAEGLGVGSAPPGWRPLTAQPLLILVGVTGVGKTTTVRAIQRLRPDLKVLPNRRFLADRLVIPAVQRAWGEEVHPVTDRVQRFAYTRAYREQHPGGLAHALSTLILDPTQWPGLLLFDGLRGVDEVRFAAQALPKAHFGVLHAPDSVRVERLLTRRDAFDQVESQAAGAGLRWSDIPESEELLSPEERERLAGLVTQGVIAPDDLRAKIAIVAAERRNYDPAGAINVLQTLAPGRTTIVDTTQATPDEAAAQILADASGWNADEADRADRRG